MFLTSEIFCQPNTIINTEVAKSIRIYNQSIINTANLEFSPCFVEEGVAFVSSEIKNKLFDPSIDESFFDISIATSDTLGFLTSRGVLNKKINSPYHEGPMAYDKVHKKLYFTRAGVEKRKVKGVSRDTSVTKIWVSELYNDKAQPVEFNLNSNQYWVCHPTISQDAGTIIFSSNQSGGNGKLDLYAAYFDGKEWVGKINLGTAVNTAYNESFPYLYNDSLLIFGSDRPGGFGGIDMYISKMKNGIWSEAELLPLPFNSAFDDFGLIIHEDGTSGYFSSNRPGGKGKDDLYFFKSSGSIFDMKIEIEDMLIVNVMDKLTFENIANAVISVAEVKITDGNINTDQFDLDMLRSPDGGTLILKLSPKSLGEIFAYKTDEEGKAKILLLRNKKYLIKASSDEHEAFSLLYDPYQHDQEIDIVLEPLDNYEEETDDEDKEITVDTEKPKVPVKAGAKLIFENIYYSYGSSEIQEGAASELDVLSEVMLANPTLSIRLEAHTDSRGPAEFNQLLSENRALAAKTYLIRRGIDAERIKTIGYGESQLRNHCKDNTSCTEKEHRYNRRTEVFILTE